jgi:hypothetical protein
MKRHADSSGLWFGAMLALAPLGILVWATGLTGFGVA